LFVDSLTVVKYSFLNCVGGALMENIGPTDGYLGKGAQNEKQKHL
jgi:hypothetical protein